MPSTITCRTYDIIPTCECIYNRQTMQAPVQTIKALTATSPNAVALVITKESREREAMPFDLFLREGFTESSRMALPLPDQPVHDGSKCTASRAIQILRAERLPVQIPKESVRSIVFDV